MQIHVSRNNQQIGAFEEAKVMEMLGNGQLLATDLGIRQGEVNWQSLGTLVQRRPTEQSVVNWARQNLSQMVEIKLRSDSLPSKIFLGFCLCFLALVFLGIPLMFYYSALSTWVEKGWTDKVTSGLVGGTFFLGAFGFITLIVFLVVRFSRGKTAKYLGSEYVEARNGTRYKWETLRYLDYKASDPTVRGQGLAVRAVTSAMTAGVKKVSVEMIFENGKAVVPPLIKDQARILALLDSIPAEKRSEGKISEA